MEGTCTEYRTEKATVRIHPGKLSEEERMEVIINAAKEFYKAIQKQQNQKSAKA
jgi:hypothetical protein